MHPLRKVQKGLSDGCDQILIFVSFNKMFELKQGRVFICDRGVEKEVCVMINFKPVTPDNFEAVINLKLHESQVGFLENNLYSLAESKVFDYLEP